MIEDNIKDNSYSWWGDYSLVFLSVCQQDIVETLEQIYDNFRGQGSLRPRKSWLDFGYELDPGLQLDNYHF